MLENKFNYNHLVRKNIATTSSIVHTTADTYRYLDSPVFALRINCFHASSNVLACFKAQARST